MTTQHVRHNAALSYLEHPVNIRPATGYPNVYQQAQDIGGEFTRIRWGLPDQAIANFSPCLLNHKGHRLLSFRSQPEPFCLPSRSKSTSTTTTLPQKFTWVSWCLMTLLSVLKRSEAVDTASATKTLDCLEHQTMNFTFSS